jgi:hypothetical protein
LDCGTLRRGPTECSVNSVEITCDPPQIGVPRRDRFCKTPDGFERTRSSFLLRISTPLFLMGSGRPARRAHIFSRETTLACRDSVGACHGVYGIPVGLHNKVAQHVTSIGTPKIDRILISSPKFISFSSNFDQTNGKSISFAVRIEIDRLKFWAAWLWNPIEIFRSQRERRQGCSQPSSEARLWSTRRLQRASPHRVKLGRSARPAVRSRRAAALAPRVGGEVCWCISERSA